jgi:hypothetical protein
MKISNFDIIGEREDKESGKIIFIKFTVTRRFLFWEFCYDVVAYKRECCHSYWRDIKDGSLLSGVIDGHYESFLARKLL